MDKKSEIKALATSLFEVLAKDAGWRDSPAHGGWINDGYQDNPDGYSDGYEVADAAEDVCFCSDVTGGDEASKLAAAAERNAKLLEEAIAALKAARQFYGKPEHANTEGQRKAMIAVEAAIEKAEANR